MGAQLFFFLTLKKMSSVSILPYGKSPGGDAVWSEKQPHRLNIEALCFSLVGAVWGGLGGQPC